MYPCKHYGQKSLKEALEEIYRKLYSEFGPRAGGRQKAALKLL